MKTDNPFDAKLAAQGHRMPDDVSAAAIWLNDTLDIMWASAQSVFEDRAQPEHAIDLLRLLVQVTDRPEGQSFEEWRKQVEGKDTE